MNYGSVCSGIEAATVAWHPLGWKAAFYSEIEAFPNAVLKHHWRETPNLGDMNGFKRWPTDPIDVLVGGTPCQSFSVAGLRKGLADPRGNLTLVFLAIVDRLRPRWVVWENVPGVLSDDGGRTFGTFLGGLGQLGYGWAYRILDAQYCGVPQRRRRVFVVGHLGDQRRAAAVLLERESLSGNPPPSRKAWEEVAGCLGKGPSERGQDIDTPGAYVAKALRAQSNLKHREDADTLVARSLGTAFHRNDTQDTLIPQTTGTLAPGAHPGGWNGQDAYSDLLIPHVTPTAPTVTSKWAKGSGGPAGSSAEVGNLVTHPLKAEGHDASEDGTGRGTPIVFTEQSTKGEVSPTFTSSGIRGRNAMNHPCIAFDCKAGGDTNFAVGDKPGALRGEGHGGGHAAVAVDVYNGKVDGAVSPTISAGIGKQNSAGGQVMSLSPDITPKFGEVAATLTQPSPSGGGHPQAVMKGMSVRRLTPRECERLQGFPDDYTLIPIKRVSRDRLKSPRAGTSYREIDGDVWQLAADGPRYKALGNSMAVPVMAWIGRRIQMVEDLAK